MHTYTHTHTHTHTPPRITTWHSYLYLVHAERMFNTPLIFSTTESRRSCITAVSNVPVYDIDMSRVVLSQFKSSQVKSSQVKSNLSASFQARYEQCACDWHGYANGVLSSLVKSKRCQDKTRRTFSTQNAIVKKLCRGRGCRAREHRWQPTGPWCQCRRTCFNLGLDMLDVCDGIVQVLCL